MIRTLLLERYLRLVVLVLVLIQVQAVAFDAAFAFSKKAKVKVVLPKSELINRRKSPALWRDELQLQQFQQQKLQPALNDDDEDSTVGKKQEAQVNNPLPLRPPEVMAPCGGFPQLKAAIANGADSVYLGLSAFSARARASNFNPEELREAVQMAHTSGVKVYVALNTLVFQNELEEVAGWIHICDKSGVDAIIVQDIGVTRLARDIAPNLEIHASTQQTVTNTDGVLFAKERGSANRVVLGRELSIEEIQSVTNDLNVYRDETGEDVEIEAFVHGALCVSYSGQCFSSEAWGGRSANRGQCAQACRLPYGLIQNGELKDLQDMSYLLSPQDLCGLDQVEELVRARVSCLKIEGRLKDEKYVAATTRAYRNAVDTAWEKIMKEHEENGSMNEGVVATTRVMDSPEIVTKAELAQLFARGQDENNDGLTSGFFEGAQHQKVVRGRSPRHRGVHVGRVAKGSYWKNGILVSIDESKRSKPLMEVIKRGDGIVIDRGMPQEEELGGPIFDVEELDKNTVLIRFGREVEKKWRKMDEASKRGIGSRMPLAPEGAHVWKTADSVVDKKMKRLIEAAQPKGTVQVSIIGDVGTRLRVEIKELSTGRVGVGESEGILTVAEQQGLQQKSVAKAIGTLGNTEWRLIDGEKNIDMSSLNNESWCPVSWVKKARQKAVADLASSYDKIEDDEESEDYSIIDINEIANKYSEIIAEMIETSNTVQEGNHEGTKISVLARNQEQIDTLCGMIEENIGIDEVIVDFLEIDGIREAVTKLKRTSVDTVVATPRIIKSGEDEIWKTLLRLQPDGLLLRSAGLMHRLQSLGGKGAIIDVGTQESVKIPYLIGDFSLNTVNTMTARELLDYGGLARVTAAYDLSAASVTELANCMQTSNGNTQLEVIVHAHLPIFHTEHCVFARFLSKGDSYLNCGHVCTKNTVHLRDESGKDNLVLADMGCRNTVFSAEAQSGVHSVPDWARAGVSTMRVELVDEGEEDVRKIVEGYIEVLNGDLRPSQLWETLKLVKDNNGRTAGVGYGSFRNMSERRAGEL